MALYQRGRIWYADYYVQGKRVQISTGTANERKAQKFLALRLAEADRGEYVKPRKVPLSESASSTSPSPRSTNDLGSGINRSWSTSTSSLAAPC